MVFKSWFFKKSFFSEGVKRVFLSLGFSMGYFWVGKFGLALWVFFVRRFLAGKFGLVFERFENGILVGIFWAFVFGEKGVGFGK